MMTEVPDSSVKVGSDSANVKPSSLRGYSVVELLTLFSALVVVTGFTFFVGFCRQLDTRLLQYVGPQDFISVSVYYILAIAIGSIVYTTFNYTDFNPDGYVIRSFVQWLNVDRELMTPEQGQWHIRVVRFGAWLSILPAITIAVQFASYAAAYFWKWKHVPADLFLPLLIASGLPVGLFTWIHSMVIERKAARRRSMALKGFVFLSLIGIFGYGNLAGALVADDTQNDVVLHTADGETIRAIFVYRFASGLAFRTTGSKQVEFVPNEKITKVDLLNV